MKNKGVEKMKKIRLLFFSLGFLFSLYLIIPGPRLPPPDLPDSLKSDLPGDTVQIPNVSAYFTDKEREEVISFYRNYFSRSSFLNIPLPAIKFNHPPERAKEIVVDTIQTYYLEELVHPLRESLFINGFNWQKDVFTPEAAKKKNKIIAGNRVWQSKVTLKWFSSSLLFRLLVFWTAWILIWVVLSLWANELKKSLLVLKRLARRKK